MEVEVEVQRLRCTCKGKGAGVGHRRRKGGRLSRYRLGAMTGMEPSEHGGNELQQDWMRLWEDDGGGALRRTAGGSALEQRDDGAGGRQLERVACRQRGASGGNVQRR